MCSGLATNTKNTTNTKDTTPAVTVPRPSPTGVPFRYRTRSNELGVHVLYTFKNPHGVVVSVSRAWHENRFLKRTHY